MDDADVEQVLHRAEIHNVRRLFEDVDVAVVTVADEDGRILWASTLGSGGVFGTDPADFVGTSRFDHVHPDDVDAVRRAYSEAVRGDTARYVLRARTVDGDWRSVSEVAWPVEGPEGRVIVSLTAGLEPG